MTLKLPYKDIAAVVIGTLILCSMAIYNKFPLVFNNDTAMYMEGAFIGFVGYDRPVLYGLLMKFVSFQTTLWFVVLLQSFMVSGLLFYFFKYFTPGRPFRGWFIGYILLITLGMGGGFMASWLMADMFTAISILCVGLLLFVRKISKVNFVIISFLTVLSMAMHNSNFYIGVFLILMLMSVYLIKQLGNKIKGAGLTLRRLSWVLLLVIASTFFLSTVHYLHGGIFKSSRGGVVFLMSNLVEMGIMDTYLADNCEYKKFSLCEYKDEIPNNFLWVTNSPIFKTGGWEKNSDEYRYIIKDIFTTSEYLTVFIYKSALMTLKQFFHFDTGEAALPTSRVDNAIEAYFPYEVVAYTNSRQNTVGLNFDLINYVQTLVFGGCLLLFIYALLFGKVPVKYQVLIGFLIMALLINAGICGVVSGVFPRYQSRIVWLIPLPLFLYAVEYLNVKSFWKTLLNRLNHDQIT